MLPSSFSGVERHLLSDHDFDYDKRDMGPIWVDRYKFGAPIEPSSSCQITETGECEGQYDAVLPLWTREMPLSAACATSVQS